MLEKYHSSESYTKYEDYNRLSDVKKNPIRKEQAERIMLAAIIIVGSNDKAHRNLSRELADQYIVGMDNYPLTPYDAEEMLNQYKVTNRGANAGGNNTNSSGNNNSKKSHNSNSNDGKDTQAKNNDKGETSEGAALTTVGTESKPKSEAHQLLLHGSANDTHDDEGFCFSQIRFEEKMRTLHRPASITGRWVCHGLSRGNLFTGNFAKTIAKLEREHTGFFMNANAIEPHNCPTSITNNTWYADEAYIFTQRNSRFINPDWLLLDSQATCNVICNPKLVENIRIHPDRRTMTIFCNAGKVTINTIADMRGYGQVWFHKQGIANCLSLAIISDSCRITLDTSVAQAFFVHKADGTARWFDRINCNLYACDISSKEQGAILAITTVNGQKKKYSDLDVRRATAARKLQDIIGFQACRNTSK